MDTKSYELAVSALAGVLSFLAAGISAVLWYLYKEAKRDVKDLQKYDLELAKAMPEIYVRKDVFAEHAKRVEDGLKLVLEKLEHKQDK